jgi:hypothetical protein
VSAGASNCKERQHGGDHNDGRCIPEATLHFTPNPYFTPNPCCDRDVQSAREARRSTLAPRRTVLARGTRANSDRFQPVTDRWPLSMMCVRAVMAPRCSDFTISQIGGMTVSISLKRAVWRLAQ